ncbi:hypothetical protein F511_35956 [Dorcoceras hygrometricum]|uniref:Protein kinase domain-containing protein n=1 Tax=Dorcoceras hygrometricum TaxID=472368 RepID=A0A2Z7DCW9_9LAMI|nr:hypothetical protein F511_35956 [Dorcoceras hygrometricum]
MKCFHFINGDRSPGDGGAGGVPRKVSWVRSLSIASTNMDTRRSDLDSDSLGDWLDSSVSFQDLLTRRRANDLRAFTFSELKSATRGFSRALLIGEGGFGCVFRGRVRILDSRSGSESAMDVAVKQLNRNGLQACSSTFSVLIDQGHKEWMNEVNLLGFVNHPNLVKLVGYCAEDDERGIQRLLVYELMRNKSLEDHLLTRSSNHLPWVVRLRIAQDAARCLAYLHEEMEFQLIFRDFKSSNILLDEDFNAKLSDFGLARQGPAAGLNHVSTSVVGTVGYAAPEYIHTGRLTTKSDVWSFGVVLYELITGRRVLERNLPRGEQKLLEWVRPYVSDPKKFHLILDQRLEGQYCMKSAQKVASLANKCLMKHPTSRPKMSEIIEMLGSIINEASLPNIKSVSRDSKHVGEEPVESEPGKCENSTRKKGFDFLEIVSRNRSIGKLDWRNWTPSLVRT